MAFHPNVLAIVKEGHAAQAEVLRNLRNSGAGRRLDKGDAARLKRRVREQEGIVLAFHSAISRQRLNEAVRQALRRALMSLKHLAHRDAVAQRQHGETIRALQKLLGP